MDFSNSTISLAQAKEYIYAMDFSMIIHKMVHQDGWLLDDALATATFYRNFLYLNKKYSNGILLPPSEDIDEFWHYHILDTQKYVEDCNHIFGFYLHHYPYLVMDHKINQDGLNDAFASTQKLHVHEFGTPIFATRSRYSNFIYRIIKRFVK